MSKFLTHTIYLADTVQLFKTYNKEKKFLFFFLKSNKILTISLFLTELLLYKKKKYLLYTLTEQKKKNVIGLIYVRLLRVLFDTIATSRMTLEVLGTGYNISHKKNSLYFNVGTSSFVEWPIANNILFRIKGKKFTRIKFYSFSKQYLHDIVKIILYLRYPNIYTGKGIYYYKLKFQSKIGKIKKM